MQFEHKLEFGNAFYIIMFVLSETSFIAAVVVHDIPKKILPRFIAIKLCADRIVPLVANSIKGV